MTEQQALKYLKDANRNNQMVGILPKSDIGKCLVNALEVNQQYMEIGTLEELRDAIEKQRAKKPIQITSTKKDGKIGKCPSCESIIGEDMIWCDDCGQRLDWGDEE